MSSSTKGKRKADASAPQSPAQKNKRGGHKVARLFSDNDYPTPNATFDPKDIPSRQKKGTKSVAKKAQGPKKGKHRAQMQEEDSGTEWEAPSQESSKVPTPAASPLPEPVQQKANQGTSTVKPKKKAKGKDQEVTESGEDQETAKPEKEFGTKRQGLHWITYAGRTHLDNLADFEEICAIRAQSKWAMYNAKAKAQKEEQRTKEMDLEIKKLNLQRLSYMPPEAIVLEFQNRLSEKDEQVAHLQAKLARMEIQKLEMEQALEKEKIERIKTERDCLAIQEKVLRKKRMALAVES